MISPGLFETAGSPSRSGRPSRSRSMAWAARQLVALIGQDSKVGLVSAAVVRSVVLRQAQDCVRSCTAATRSVRPSASKSVARRPETWRSAESHLHDRTSWNRPSRSLSIATGGDLSAVSTRSRSRSLSMSSSAMPV